VAGRSLLILTGVADDDVGGTGEDGARVPTLL
jgi:hypothetical protein